MILSFDAKRFFHNNRGLGNYSRDVIRLLATYYPENKYFLLNPKPVKGVAYLIPDQAREILPNSFFYKRFPGLWRTKGSLSTIQKIGTTIYHGLNQELPQGIHRTKIKSVVTIHDAIFIRYPELYDPFYRKIFIAKNKYSCKVADRIIAISQQTKSDAIEFFNADPSKIEVVYQGCNRIFREKITNEKMDEVKHKYNLPSHYLLNVGAIEKRKNIELAIKALVVGKIQIPLIIIGNKTKYENTLQELINQFNFRSFKIK